MTKEEFEEALRQLEENPPQFNGLFISTALAHLYGTCPWPEVDLWAEMTKKEREDG